MTLPPPSGGAGAQERGYLPNLQILRFVAATMVLAHHLLLELASPRLALPVSDLIGVDWSIGVDIFFMVSGFIMCFLTYDHFHERGYAAEFLKRRFLRVAPLYWLFTSLMLLSILVSPQSVSHNDVSAGRVISSYLFYPWPRAGGDVYPILGLGWTLNYEIEFYLLLGVALLAPRRIGVGALTALFLAAAALGRWAPSSWTALRFWSDPVIVEFMLGFLLGWLFRRGVRLGGLTRVGLIVSGFGLSMLFMRIGLADHVDRDLWGGAPAFLIATGAVLGPRAASLRAVGWRAWVQRGLVLGGDASYALYLCHMFSIRLLTTVWTKLHLHSPGLYLACGLVLATGVAIAVHLAVERPILSLLKTLTGAKARAPAPVQP